MLQPVTPQLPTLTNPRHFQPLNSSSSAMALCIFQESLAWPWEIWTILITPSRAPNQLPSIIDQCTQHLPTSVFWASTSTRWIWVSTPSVMGAKPAIGLHQTPTLFLLIVIVCAVGCPLILCLLSLYTPWFFVLASLLPQLLALVDKHPFACIMTILNIELHQLVIIATAIYLYSRTSPLLPLAVNPKSQL